jgi:hypothetical protein
MTRDLFDVEEPIPVNTSVVAEEAPRLSKQCRAILDRLQLGPASNSELASIALKYTGRVSEIRKAGHDIRVIEKDHKTGRVVYGLYVGD